MLGFSPITTISDLCRITKSYSFGRKPIKISMPDDAVVMWCCAFQLFIYLFLVAPKRFVHFFDVPVKQPVRCEFWGCFHCEQQGIIWPALRPNKHETEQSAHPPDFESDEKAVIGAKSGNQEYWKPTFTSNQQGSWRERINCAPNLVNVCPGQLISVCKRS